MNKVRSTASEHTLALPGPSPIDNRQSALGNLPANLQSAFRNPQSQFDLWASIYDTAPNPLLRLEERFLPGILGEVCRLAVADLACGTGRWMSWFLQTGAGECFGIDFNTAMLKRACGKPGLAGRLVCGDLPQLPFRCGSFDLLLCSFALGYLASLEPVAAGFSRVLRPGGRLICTDLHPAVESLGWKRSFRNGSGVVELESVFHPVPEVVRCFAKSLALVQQQEWFLDEPERPLFESAGKLAVFHQARQIPAVVCLEWRKR